MSNSYMILKSRPDNPKRDFNTYYLSGNKVVGIFDMATRTTDDIDWLNKGPDNNIVSQHFNLVYWCYDRKVLYLDPQKVLGIMECVRNIPDDHELVKAIQMYKLLGALPTYEDSRHAVNEWRHSDSVKPS